MKHLLPAVQRTALRIPWAAVGGCAAALLLTAAAPGRAVRSLGTGGGGGSRRGLAGSAGVVCAAGRPAVMSFTGAAAYRRGAADLLRQHSAVQYAAVPAAPLPAYGRCVRRRLTQLPYLIQRGGRQWALCMAALALLYGAAALLPDLLPESAAEQADKRRAWFLLLLGVCAVPAGWTVMGFSPAAVLTAVLLLYFVGRAPVPDAAAAVRWRG